MNQCWDSEPDERPRFAELHRIFDEFLGKHVQDRYPYIDLQMTQLYNFDRLEPQLGDNSIAEDGNCPINLDIEDVDAGEPTHVQLRTREDRLANSLQLQVPANRLSTHSWPGSEQEVHVHLREVVSERVSVERDVAEPEIRYVESPVGPSRNSTLISPDLTTQEDLVTHLEDKLSTLSEHATRNRSHSFGQQIATNEHGNRDHSHKAVTNHQSYSFDHSQGTTSQPGTLRPISVPTKLVSLSVPEVRYENGDVHGCDYDGEELDSSVVIFKQTEL